MIHGEAVRRVERQAFSAREVQRLYRIPRGLVYGAIHRGELLASQVEGRRAFTILRSDLESWIRSHAVRPSTHAQGVVERRLEREGAVT